MPRPHGTGRAPHRTRAHRAASTRAGAFSRAKSELSALEGQLKVAQFVASPDAYAASSEATPWPAPREEEGAEGEPPPED